MADKPELESLTILKSVVDEGRLLVRLVKICRLLEDVKGCGVIVLVLLVHLYLLERWCKMDRATRTLIC